MGFCVGRQKCSPGTPGKTVGERAGDADGGELPGWLNGEGRPENVLADEPAGGGDCGSRRQPDSQSELADDGGKNNCGQHRIDQGHDQRQRDLLQDRSDPFGVDEQLFLVRHNRFRSIGQSTSAREIAVIVDPLESSLLPKFLSEHKFCRFEATGRQVDRRVRNAAASVPSSSTSNAPPIGTPWPTRVMVTPVGRSWSVSQWAVAAPSTVAPRARMTSVTSPSTMRFNRPGRVRSSGPMPAMADRVPPRTW